MTGFDEAMEWLAANEPDWTIYRSETTLHDGLAYGDPTQRRVSLVLVKPDPVHGFVRDDVRVSGEGSTHLEAVKNALGAWAASGKTADKRPTEDDPQ